MLASDFAGPAGGSCNRASCAGPMQFQVLLLADFPCRCDHCRIKYLLARFLPQERAPSAFQHGDDVGITQSARNVQHIIYLAHTFANFAHGHGLCVCQA